MIESKGRMDYCPFRIYEETRPALMVGDADRKIQFFAPCLKENCMCYQKHMSSDGKTMTENCYRDNLEYERKSEVQDD